MPQGNSISRSRSKRGRSFARLMVEELEPRCLPSAVLTYHYNSALNGQDLSETALTPSNVNVSHFGKAFTTTVDGQVYAQPLYVGGLTVTGGSNPGTHNVVFVATEH